MTGCRPDVPVFAFDPCTPWGTREHYFHFLHGYLLPALSLALNGGMREVRFEDCGPVMAPRIAEACALLSLNLVPPPPTDEARCQQLAVPRWDRLLLRPGAPPQPACVLHGFRNGSALIRQRLLAAAERAAAASGSLARWRNTDVIVFRRSQEHPFYLSPRMARGARYGQGRRNLKNVDDIAAALSAAGLRATVLDLGTLCLADQIMACHHARAVIGIRGAEFANLIWMRPDSAAVMLAPPIKIENHASRTLAAIFGVRFSSPPVDAAKIDLPPELAAALIREVMAPRSI